MELDFFSDKIQIYRCHDEWCEICEKYGRWNVLLPKTYPSSSFHMSRFPSWEMACQYAQERHQAYLQAIEDASHFQDLGEGVPEYDLRPQSSTPYSYDGKSPWNGLFSS